MFSFGLKNTRRDFVNEYPSEILETNVNYVDSDDMASVTVFETKHKKQIRTLAEKYPDEIRIIDNGDKRNSMLVAHLPRKYCHISFGGRVKREMTDEQKAAASERMKKAQEVRRVKMEAKKQEEKGWL